MYKQADTGELLPAIALGVVFYSFITYVLNPLGLGIKYELCLMLITISIYTNIIYFYSIIKNIEYSIIFTLTFIFILAFIRIEAISYIYYLFSIYSIYKIRKIIKLGKRDFKISALVSLALVAINNKFYKPFSIVEIINEGLATKDFLYHSSYAAIIKNYSAVSNGINGLLEAPYHVFSHGLVAEISRIANIKVVLVYEYIPTALFQTLFIYSVCKFINDYYPEYDKRKILEIVVAIILCYPIIFGKFGGWNQYLTSESYTLGLVFMLLSMKVIFTKKWTLANKLYMINLGWISTLSKVSIGIMIGIMLISQINIKTLKNDINKVIYFSIPAIIIFIYIWSGSTGVIGVEGSHFVSEYLSYTNNEYINSMYILVLYSPVLIYIYFSKSEIEYKWIIISSIFSIILIIFFNIPGGSVYYFYNIPFIVLLKFYAIKSYNFINKVNLNFGLLLIIVSILLITFNKLNYWKEMSDNKLIRSILFNKFNKNEEIEKLKLWVNGSYKCNPFILPALTEQYMYLNPQYKECDYKGYGLERAFK